MNNTCLKKRVNGNVGETKLMKVINEKADLEVIKKFLDETEDINARNRSGFTALMFAALSNDDPEVIRLLIEAGANVNVKSSLGRTPLMYAARYNTLEVVNELIKAGADMMAWPINS